MTNPKGRQFDPTFPKPSKFGPRLTVWSSADIDAWIDKALGQTGVSQ